MDKHKVTIIKVNTRNRNAVKLSIDNKPDAVKAIVRDRVLGGKDMRLEGQDVSLRLVCNTAPTDDMARWTFGGNGFESLGGWLRGDAVFIGFDPREQAVCDVPVDAAWIQERLRWFDPAVDTIGPADGSADGAEVEAEPRQDGEAEGS